MKLTVYYDGQFWVGVVEENRNGKLRAGRYLFGAEPKDQEVLEFVNGRLLAFMNGLSEEVAIKHPAQKKVNPKRLARLVSREVKANGVSTYAQSVIQLEYEKRKLDKQVQSKERREELNEYKREVKRQKAKEKHRGR